MANNKQEKLNEKWHKIKYFNPYLSWEANIKNGVKLPEKEYLPVVCFDSDKPTYFIGRFCNNQGHLTCYESLTGREYPINYLYWQEFSFPEREDFYE